MVTILLRSSPPNGQNFIFLQNRQNYGSAGGFPENGTKREETGEVYLQGLFERRHQVTLHVHIDLAGHRFPPSPFLFKLAQLGPLGR